MAFLTTGKLNLFGMALRSIDQHFTSCEAGVFSGIGSCFCNMGIIKIGTEHHHRTNAGKHSNDENHHSSDENYHSEMKAITPVMKTITPVMKIITAR
jgi:hypothetical protein